jgi:hypothetical protein
MMTGLADVGQGRKAACGGQGLAPAPVCLGAALTSAAEDGSARISLAVQDAEQMIALSTKKEAWMHKIGLIIPALILLAGPAAATDKPNNRGYVVGDGGVARAAPPGQGSGAAPISVNEPGLPAEPTKTSRKGKPPLMSPLSPPGESTAQPRP